MHLSVPVLISSGCYGQFITPPLLPLCRTSSPSIFRQWFWTFSVVILFLSCTRHGKHLVNQEVGMTEGWENKERSPREADLVGFWSLFLRVTTIRLPNRWNCSEQFVKNTKSLLTFTSRGNKLLLTILKVLPLSFCYLVHILG